MPWESNFSLCAKAKNCRPSRPLSARRKKKRRSKSRLRQAKKRARTHSGRALPVNRRSRLVAGAPSSRCLLRRRRLRYRGSLVSRGGRGRGRLRGARTQAKHDSGCGKKDKYFHSLNSFVECSAQASRTDVFLANFFSD